MKLGKEFSDNFGLLRAGAKLNDKPQWEGKNKTPKTDIKSGRNKISLKKFGGSQLMSIGTAEAVSTFHCNYGNIH